MKSFFEYLNIAHIERVHSQILAWIFSPYCKAIDEPERIKLLSELFGMGESSVIINVYTEWNNVDLVIECNKHVIVIENKLKSSQHSNQLEKYKAVCEKCFPEKAKKYFYLTLIGEDSNHTEWHKLTYLRINEVLSKAQLSAEATNNHVIILKEYLVYLSELKQVLDVFINNTNEFDMVFKDGKKKKKDKHRDSYKNDYEHFIARNQLETILQKHFLAEIANKIKKPEGIISETHGDALINFVIAENIKLNGKTYSTMLQFQHNTYKFAFMLNINNRPESKLEYVEASIPIMTEFAASKKYGYHRLNYRSKAYVSISKKRKTPYWKISVHELCGEIKNEIENCKSLTASLAGKLGAIFEERPLSEGISNTSANQFSISGGNPS